MRAKIGFILLVFVTIHYGQAQTESTPQDTLLRWIAALQIETDSFYHSGLFPSQRISKKQQYQDNTLFYSGLIANTLNKLVEWVPSDQAMLIDSIRKGVMENTWRYRSRRGRPTYNFWQTDPDIPHPNGPAKYQADKYKIPDDFDDTSTIGLMLQDEEEVASIRKEMVRYTAERKKKVKTVKGPFKKSIAYGVWYADKWKQEFDVCVLSNTLRFTLAKGFTLNMYDSASITMIEQMVNDDLHQRKPFLASPYYPNTSIILYHLAALISEDSHGLFDTLKSKIVQDCYQELSGNNNEWERLLLLTSLMKMGEFIALEIDPQKLRAESKTFYWYSANLMSAIGSGILPRRLFKTSGVLPSLYWNCEAFNWTLYYEYLVYSEAVKR